MDPKLLTENGWKTNVVKFKLKDKELQRALSFYEALDVDDFDSRLKALVKIGTFAAALKKDKEVAALPVVKYLADMVSATESEKSEITKAKLLAEKTKALAAKAQAVAQNKAGAEATKRKQEEQKAQEEGERDEEEEEGEQGDYVEKLKKAINTLKTAKAPYNFIVCDAKPQIGVMVTKQLIGAKHKEELTKVTGSKRFLKAGTCRRESSTLIFEMENPPQGLAGKLLKAIKYFTGMKYKVMVGDEAAEDESGDGEGAKAGTGDAQTPAKAAGATASAAAPEAPAAPPTEKEMEVLQDRRRDFKKARAAWVAAKIKAESDLEKVKEGARMTYLADAKQFPKVVQGCKDIDAILDNLDDELRDTLDQYASTSLKNQGKLHALAATAAEIVDRYRTYVQGNQVMKAIDKKEFADVTIHAPIMKALTDLRKALS